MGHPLPIDPDLEPAVRPRWPHIPLDVAVAVLAGGCIGGLVRYVVTRAWPTPAGGFPVSTLVVNLAGAFVLAVVVVAATERQPGRLLRPLLGTGFCGALTTFSSVVVSTDRLLGSGRIGTGAGYVAASFVGGLAAAAAGWALARRALARPGSDRC